MNPSITSVFFLFLIDVPIRHSQIYDSKADQAPVDILLVQRGYSGGALVKISISDKIERRQYHTHTEMRTCSRWLPRCRLSQTKAPVDGAQRQFQRLTPRFNHRWKRRRLFIVLVGRRVERRGNGRDSAAAETTGGPAESP